MKPHINRLKSRLIIASTIAGLVFTILAWRATAQVTPTYDLSWFSIDNSGGSSAGGYQLTGFTGQPDAGRMTGGIYTLEGGFGAPPIPWRIYLPITNR